MEQGKIRSSGELAIAQNQNPQKSRLNLSVVSCQGRGKREQGTGRLSGVRSQESGVSYPLSGKNDARKSGDRAQENPSIWCKIMQIYG